MTTITTAITLLVFVVISILITLALCALIFASRYDDYERQNRKRS